MLKICIYTLYGFFRNYNCLDVSLSAAFESYKFQSFKSYKFQSSSAGPKANKI